MALSGEKYVTITTQGYEVQFRTRCMGTTGPALLLETGAFESAYDFEPIQSILSKNYTVCAYDRAGYGKSWASVKPRTKAQMMAEMVAVM
jgi:pimeloyl-ACP methyl ester carboxylesterase